MPHNSREVNFLNAVYRNADMGISAISSATDKTDDDNLKKDLSVQLHEFRALQAQVERKLRQHGEAPNSTAMGKLGLQTSLKLSLMLDKTPSNIARIMIDGTTTGVSDLNTMLNDNSSMQDTDIKNMAARLIEIEQRTAEMMKFYL